MQSSAKTVSAYLKNLPRDRREAITRIHKAIVKALPKGYKEIMQYGMISYVVPLKLYPKGYLENKNVPLPFAALASQKNHMAVYLMCIYTDPVLLRWFKDAYKKSGKRIDIGKSCIRFKRIEDLPLDIVAKAISRVPVKKHIALYEQSRKRSVLKSKKE
jgi:hypothetical protein